MNKPTEQLKERLKKALDIRNLTQQELSERTQIPNSSISQYLSGYAKPKDDRVYAMAVALDVNEAWLLGFDVPMNRGEISSNVHSGLTDKLLSNIFPISVKKFPLLGEIACGEPIFANEDRESYVMAGTDIDADFCLKAKGNSMMGARILDGDIVFIKETDIVNNGEIAAVIIDDEVLLKRFYYFKDENLLTLQSENPQYPPKNYKDEQLNHIRVIGRAVAFQSDII